MAGAEDLWRGDTGSLLPHRHKPCPSDGDVAVGLSDETEADGQDGAATVLKHLLKPSAEPPIMSLHHFKPFCKTHLGPLNDFYTPGSFPDSHFIQLKSHSAPPPLPPPPTSFDGESFEPTFQILSQ